MTYRQLTFMNRNPFRVAFVLIPLLMLLCGTSPAEDTFYHSPLNRLGFKQGQLPEGFRPGRFDWQYTTVFHPYAVVEGGGEAYIGGENLQPWTPPGDLFRNSILTVRVSKDKPARGTVFVPKEDFSGFIALPFTLEAANSTPESRAEFFKAKERHYRELRDREIPGGAWFRFQETEAAKAHGAQPAAPTPNPWRSRGFRRGLDEDYDSTYDLFSGGRALSENLQLDRVLPATASEAATVEISTLKGITVREMDWEPLLKGAEPKTDVLAACVPFDQHALFFPDFHSLTVWLDEADSDGTPVLQMFEPRSEDANSRGRYQRQLCLELSDLSRLLGPKVITSAAFTGSDPYLRTGTDIAMLYETKSAAILVAFIRARQAAAQKTNSAVKTVQGEFEGVAFSGVETPDRSICSYVAGLKETVYVSNSRFQLTNLLTVAQGKKAALSFQDEYKFFRSRYPAGESNETAFLVLSDATIRRWCGPQWRIGNSRRTRVAGALAALQAEHMAELAAGATKEATLKCMMPEAGEVKLTAAGVISSTYGTLDFLTPIVELPLTKVSQAEANAYNRWCAGYQQNWSQFFDPIAVRFSLDARQLGAEVTVMPLIAASEYRHFADLSTGSSIGANSGDRHPEALLQAALALNTQSGPIKDAGNFLGNFNSSLKANPLGWLGQSMAIYADRDAFWDELRHAEKSSDFLEKNYPRLPVAAYFEVKNPLGLTAFLASLRAYVEQTAPKMTTWENFEHQGQPYVRIRSIDSAGSGMATNLCVYYAATAKSLTVTLSEPLLKRALERQAGAAQASEMQRPWLGTNLCLQVAQDFVPALDSLFRDQHRIAQQLLAWNNIPILNEWKRRFPEQDPLKVHEQFWQTKLLCPGGGSYVWNEKWQTMESTVYGHPGEPKPGPDAILPLKRIASANLGLSFENQGLSARAILERNSPAK